MIRNIKRTYFEVWGDEVAQNKILKGLLLFVIALTGIESVTICILALRRPFIIAVSEDATRALVVIPPSTALLEREALRVLHSNGPPLVSLGA